MSRGFMDLRDWIARLEKENELRRVRAEVDWDREIGAVCFAIVVLSQRTARREPVAAVESVLSSRD